MVSPLDRKLFRDLSRMKTQAVAIALVIGTGVMLLVMMSGLVSSLSQTRDAYYDRFRLADVFAPVQRAPERVVERLSGIDGVGSVYGRISGGALIDLKSESVPVRALAISLPEFRTPDLNDIYLTDGRMIDPRQRDEIILLNGFATAHGLRPGDAVTATLHGARRSFRIAGLAEAPEFIYSAAPGELVPDDRRFAVIWMNRKALEAAYDLDGAVDEVLIQLERGGSLDAVLAAVDRELAPYGGTGAYGRNDHFSDRFVQEEITSLRITARSVPPVFLAVAAFLLYIVVSRMIAAERTQIGLLKAFGYSSLEVGWHYVKLVLVIAGLGAGLGCVLGVYFGRQLASYYQLYYKFPFLEFDVAPGVFVGGIAISTAAASAGGIMVLRQVFGLTPAVAMRPPAPEDYARSAGLSEALKRVLDQPSRMVVRRLTRQPMRAFIAVIGIAAGMGLSVAMLGVMNGFEKAISTSFTIVDRSDATVTFIEPLGDKTIFELKRLEGVQEVEPFRAVDVVLRHGTRTHRTAISGLVGTPRLNRALAEDLSPISLEGPGLVLSKPLAEKLDLRPGEHVVVEVREGRRPTVSVPVTGVAQTLLGAPVFMEISALNEKLREPGRVSGAYLRIDRDQRDRVYKALKDMPAVAGVGLREDAWDAFRDIMDSGAGATRYIMAMIAGIITFGIVYNSARIAFAERSHDLASLRVIGFTKSETAFVLLGELAVVTILALPLGTAIGYGLMGAIAAGFSTDLYTVPATLNPVSVGSACLVVLGSAALSGWLVKRNVDGLELVSALKSRE